MNDIRRLPTAEITLDIEGIKNIKTKATIAYKNTDLDYNTLGSETKTLIKLKA